MDADSEPTPRQLDELFELMCVAPDTVRTDLDERMVLTTHARSTRPPPAPAPARPELVLGREIGRGGMGLVVLAEQTALGREVAVKRLRRRRSARSSRRRSSPARSSTRTSSRSTSSRSARAAPRSS